MLVKFKYSRAWVLYSIVKCHMLAGDEVRFVVGSFLICFGGPYLFAKLLRLVFKGGVSVRV